MAQHATTLPEQQPTRAARHPRNVSNLERGLSLIGGAALVLYGLRRSLGVLSLMLGGGALIYRGLTGYCAALPGSRSEYGIVTRAMALRSARPSRSINPPQKSIVSGVTWRTIPGLCGIRVCGEH